MVFIFLLLVADGVIFYIYCSNMIWTNIKDRVEQDYTKHCLVKIREKHILQYMKTFIKHERLWVETYAYIFYYRSDIWKNIKRNEKHVSHAYNLTKKTFLLYVRVSVQNNCIASKMYDALKIEISVICNICFKCLFAL